MALLTENLDYCKNLTLTCEEKKKQKTNNQAHASLFKTTLKLEVTILIESKKIEIKI